MGSDSDIDESRPSLVDAMQSCELSSSAKDESSGHDMRLLPEGYEPGADDVLCGRGRKCFNHPGNVKFRSIVQSFLPQYSRSVAKLEKSYILSDVVELVRKNSGEGGFIKKDPDTGRWYEVGDFLAREKTSQAFRDVLHDKYKSSNTAKKKRRQEDQAEKLFRTPSSRSLGASSLDASSVHSVGSSTTGDYMLADSKLMRMERSDSALNVGDGLDNDDEFAEDDEHLGGHDHGSSNHSRSSNPHEPLGKGQGVNCARSLGSGLDFDGNRQALMSHYSRSSCPNLLSRSQLSHSGSMPPISQIEIIVSGGNQGRRKSRLELAAFDADIDSFGTAATQETTVASIGGSEAGSHGHQTWFHHSQPNLFGDNPPVNHIGGQRPQFARQPLNQLIGGPSHGRTTSVNSGGLATVQQQIGNLGLNESNNGGRNMGGLDGSNHSSPYSQAVTSQGNLGGSTRNVGGSTRNLGGSMRNLGRSLGGPPKKSYDSNNRDSSQGLHPQANAHKRSMLGDLSTASLSTAPDTTDVTRRDGVSTNASSIGGGGDTLLLERLSALENTGFGMEFIDENPFEPVPLREV